MVTQEPVRIVRLHDLHQKLKAALAEWAVAHRPEPLPDGHQHVQTTVAQARTRDRDTYRFIARVWCWCGAEHLVTSRVRLDAAGNLHVDRAQTQAHKPRRGRACVLPSPPTGA